MRNVISPDAAPASAIGKTGELDGCCKSRWKTNSLRIRVPVLDGDCAKGAGERKRIGSSYRIAQAIERL